MRPLQPRHRHFYRGLTCLQQRWLLLSLLLAVDSFLFCFLLLCCSVAINRAFFSCPFFFNSFFLCPFFFLSLFSPVFFCLFSSLFFFRMVFLLFCCSSSCRSIKSCCSSCCSSSYSCSCVGRQGTARGGANHPRTLIITLVLAYNTCPYLACLLHHTPGGRAFTGINSANALQVERALSGSVLLYGRRRFLLFDLAGGDGAPESSLSLHGQASYKHTEPCARHCVHTRTAKNTKIQ